MESGSVDSSSQSQLSGYLVYKPGGTFSRLKSSRRQFYLLDSRHWHLFFYRCEEDFRARRPPLGSIALGEAAISLAPDNDSYQFVIHSEGKEHILTADSHRAMMTWALALQTKRDAWDKMVSLGKQSDDPAVRLSYTEAQQMALRENQATNDNSFLKCASLQLKGQKMLRRLSSSTPVSWEKRRHSTFADVGLMHNSEPPIRRPDCNLSRSSSNPQLAEDTPSSISEEKNGEATSNRVENHPQCDTICEESRSSEEKYSSPETESASESDRIGIEEDDQSAPFLRLSEAPYHERLNGVDDVLAGSDDEEVDSRVAVLQNELICVKCELAKCLNRENACKIALEAKAAELKQAQETKQKDTTRRELSNLKDQYEMLQNQNKFLNDEILKLSRMLQQEQFRNHSKHLNLQEKSSEVDQLKRDYVFLLQSCIRITCTDGPEMMELYMYGEKRHKQRVFALLEEARKTNPSLPNLEGMTTSLCHVDSLGFKHVFVDKSLILHYVCRQLHHHYSTQLRAHERHLAAWRQYLRVHPRQLASTVSNFKMELKNLVRGGIPEQLRSRVWVTLYRMRIQDLKESKGSEYFSSLCNMATDSEVVEQHKRQISLDLLRTMPNNINFCDRNADGIKKMQDVLNAFCLHNPKLGYCQGMNFLVGMMLLFMDTEDAFWCLVAIIERYFPSSYFDQNLIGAQVDQEVLKELLKNKLPKISAHLAALDIELSTITLNWFLSIFIDSVPQETLLRIWDCFILEGPKVLFRFSLGLLWLQEECILAKHDTVSIMRQLKAAAKLCFDVEGLISASFEELEPFPSREEIGAKQAAFHKILLERAKKKERELHALRERERMMSQVELEGPHNHLIECAAVWNKDKVWVCHGHHHGSRVSMVNCQESIMYRLHIEFESRVMCMHAPNDDTMLFGTYSHFVHAYHTVSRKKMWEICLNACILSLCSHQRDGVKQVFAGLADGTLAVVENVQGRMPKPEVFYVVIGSNPVTCLQLVGRRLWCACGSNVIILSARTLDLLDQFQTSSNGLDYIYRMVTGEQGVWITLRGSSILQLWDPHSLTCRLLYDVRDNYSMRTSKVDETYTNHARITCVLPFDSSVLVGTADGTLIFYDVIARKSPSPSAPSSPRPIPPQPEPGQTNAKQIQERLQKLFIEQQLMEGGDNSQGSPKSNAGESPNLTPSSCLSRRESSTSSKDSGSDAPMPQEEETIASIFSHQQLAVEFDKGAHLYGKGFRKGSFAISTPIAEEKPSKFDEEEPEAEEGLPQPSTPPTEDIIAQPVDPVPPASFTPKDQKSNEEPPFLDQEPQELSRFCHVDAGDLMSSEKSTRNKIVSAFEFKGSLSDARTKYQSLSAEDIPTWVAQEKPQPVISAKGDVTFKYKSRLPSIKAFIRKEANELASFLKASENPEPEPEPILPTTASRKNCPFFSIRPPTIDFTDQPMMIPRSSPIMDDRSVSPGNIEITVEGTSDTTSPEPSIRSTYEPPQSLPESAAESRRSSAAPEDVLPAYLSNDEDFLSTAQFNDLLQLQDWTRTSRKGSDTASNVSFGSNEVPFAFELVLKEKNKISDKPIRCLLQASCNDEPIIISCAGYYRDDEAVLKWMKEGEEKLWTNDPIVEVCPLTHTMKPSPYARSRLPRRASIATTALGGSSSADIDGSFLGRSSHRSSSPSPAGVFVESGIAKMQHLLSRVSDRT